MAKTKKKADTLSQASGLDTTRQLIVADEGESKQVRTRNFATVIYPDSAPANWQEIIADWHVETLVSPLHDKDVNPDGTVKKPHRHVQLMFQAPHTKAQARALFQQINGVGCEVINSTRGSARYLCHLDNPEKARYDIKDVLQFSGADYQTLIQLPSDKIASIREMIHFIELNGIMSFNALVQWCSENNETWFRALCDNSAYIIKEYLASRYFCHKEQVSTSTCNWVTTPEARLLYIRAQDEPQEDEQ